MKKRIRCKLGKKEFEFCYYKPGRKMRMRYVTRDRAIRLGIVEPFKWTAAHDLAFDGELDEEDKQMLNALFQQMELLPGGVAKNI